MSSLAHYRLLRLLGEGGQGTTYLALDRRLSRRVVIKLYTIDGSLQERRSCAAEARRTALLEGPRVVRVLDVVASGPYLALVLAYVPGCDLAALLQADAVLPLVDTLVIGGDIAAALAAARQQLLVHGDVKPGNVLLGLDGRAVLGDFGIAVSSGTGAEGGSRFSLTPEHCRGEALTQQSDFFALGVLLYRMLFGVHPFMNGDELDRQRLCEGLTHCPPLPRCDDPAQQAAVSALLARLLAASPSDRFPSAAALRRALHDLRHLCATSSDLIGRVRRHVRDETVRTGSLAPLPVRLVRPPLAERVRSRVSAWWQRASGGARALSAALLAIAASLPVLWALQPGPCITLQPASVDVPLSQASAMPSSTTLDGLLLAALRDHFGPVVVLGPVPGSDSRFTLRERGVRDACEPQRTVRLSLRCDGSVCDVELRSTDPDSTRRSQLRVPTPLGLADARAAMDRLLRRLDD